MLKCVLVGNQRYLVADLEEPCFEGDHLYHVMFLTLPQIILVVIGLPLLSLFTILRNDHHFERYNFRMRYGLLYLGYRENREWWETIIAFRKVLVVMIGTFGTMMGAADLQLFLALFVIFISILVHLVGKPFDTNEPKSLLLHQLECAALTLCWLTFWGGMIFYLGHERPDLVGDGVKVVMSLLIVGANVIFLVFSTYKFIHEFIQDFKHKAEVRRQSRISITHLQAATLSSGLFRQQSTKVMPAIAPELVLGSTASQKKELTSDRDWAM
jgi:hypothetical protein